MNRLVIVSSLFIFLMGLSLNSQAGVAPINPRPVLEKIENVPQSETLKSKPKWHKRLGQKWRRFAQTKAAKYLKAFILFALIGTGLYVLGVFVAAGTILTTVIATTTLAELISGGLYIGAYICYLYAFYAGIAAIIHYVLGTSGVS